MTATHCEIVVGYDGSPAAENAIAFAFEEAALRGVPLVAVCALADSPGVLGEARPVGIVHPQPVPAVGAHTLGVARQLVSVGG
jgi:nucleotide-binding universal stress UspA family protein